MTELTSTWHHTHSMFEDRFGQDGRVIRCQWCRACACHMDDFLMVECTAARNRKHLQTAETLHHLKMLPADAFTAEIEGDFEGQKLAEESEEIRPEAGPKPTRTVVNVVLTESQYQVLSKKAASLGTSEEKYLIWAARIGHFNDD